MTAFGISESAASRVVASLFAAATTTQRNGAHPMSRTCIYFARAGMAVKIGRSNFPIQRCRALTKRTGLRHELRVYVRNAPKGLEKFFHRFLSAERLTEGCELFRGPKTEALLAELLMEVA